MCWFMLHHNKYPGMIPRNLPRTRKNKHWIKKIFQGYKQGLLSIYLEINTIIINTYTDCSNPLGRTNSESPTDTCRWGFLIVSAMLARGECQPKRCHSPASAFHATGPLFGENLCTGGFHPILSPQLGMRFEVATLPAEYPHTLPDSRR